MKIEKRGWTKKDKIFFIIGVFLFCLWFFETYIKMSYFREYSYLWFCLISLLLLSISFMLRSRTFIMSFLPIAIGTQFLWNMDYFLLIFNLPTITTNSNYMFDYGQSLIDFIIGLKHLFIISLGFIGLKYFNKPISKYAWIYCIIIGLMIMIISPLIPANNLNCASYSCFGDSNGNFSIVYSITLFVISFIICIIFLYIPINILIKKAKKDKKYLKILNLIIIILLVIGMLGVVLGFFKYVQIPHYSCLNQNSDIFCEKAYSNNLSSVYFSYHLVNRLDNKCNITAITKDGELLGQKEQLILEDPAKGYIFVQIPDKNKQVYLKANCVKI